MRNHPAVMKLVHEKAVGYDDAEAILRGRKDAESTAAVLEIDEARARARVEALAQSKDMAGRLGLDLDGVRRLVDDLAGDAELETWLARRVQLAKAHGEAPAHDDHPTNE